MRALTKPWCHNRPPFAVADRGEWHARQGHHAVIRYMLGLERLPSRWRWTGERWELRSTGKPRYRWHRWFSTDRCAAWDCPESATPAPVIDRYDCRGCRWLPERGHTHYYTKRTP